MIEKTPKRNIYIVYGLIYIVLNLVKRNNQGPFPGPQAIVSSLGSFKPLSID
jgi:hypothetical protein